MKLYRLRLAVLFSLSALAVPALAQQAATQPPAAAASAVAATPECTSAMKRHDHGAERNAPAPAAMPCKSPSAASAAGSENAKRIPPHDHAKFHKNQ